jgi:hypothetical protein
MTFDYDSEPKETVHDCNFCGSKRFTPFAKRDRYGLAVKTVRCRECGLVFINPRMTADGYRRFYAEGHYRTQLTQFYKRPMYAAEIEAGQTTYLEPYLAKRVVSTLLDVGGSTGVVSEVMRCRFGLEATVLEPSNTERALAAKRGLKTLNATVEGFSPNCWDLVLLCQTVDHLLDIAGALKTLRRAVSSRGLFYMDACCMDLWLERSTPEEVVKVDHPFYLYQNRCHAEMYLGRAGFEVVGRLKGQLWYQAGYVCKPKKTA